MGFSKCSGLGTSGSAGTTGCTTRGCTSFSVSSSGLTGERLYTLDPAMEPSCDREMGFRPSVLALLRRRAGWMFSGSDARGGLSVEDLGSAGRALMMVGGALGERGCSWWEMCLVALRVGAGVGVVDCGGVEACRACWRGFGVGIVEVVREACEALYARLETAGSGVLGAVDWEDCVPCEYLEEAELFCVL